MTDAPVIVARFGHRHQAELARGFLEDAGIPSVLTVDDGGGAFGAPLTFTPASFATLRVRPEDAERAREILEETGVLEEEDEEEDEGEDGDANEGEDAGEGDPA